MKKIILLSISFIVFIMMGTSFSQIIRKPERIQSEEEQTFGVNIGLNFTTQYLWRGLALANSPAFEPYGKFNFWDFEFDVIGIYGMNTAIPNTLAGGTKAVNFSKVELRLNYMLTSDIGNFTFGFRDYIFPYLRIQYIDSLGRVAYKASTYFDFQSAGTGAHTVEANIRYDGPKEYPFWLFFASNIYNDPHNSWYIEGGINFYISTEKFAVFLGGTHGPSQWYQIIRRRHGVSSLPSIWGPTNAGLGWEKVIPLSGSMSIPVGLKYVYNPWQDNYYVALTVGFNVGE